MPVRIYDISKKLGLENKEVLAKAKELGIAAARVASSSLDKITAEYLEQQLILAHPNRPSASAATPAAGPVETPVATQSAPAPVVTASLVESAPTQVQEVTISTAGSTAVLEPPAAEMPAVAQTPAPSSAPVEVPNHVSEPKPTVLETPEAGVKPIPSVFQEPAALPALPLEPVGPKLGDKVGFVQLPPKPGPKLPDKVGTSGVKLPPRPPEPRRTDFTKRGDIRSVRGPGAPTGPSVPGAKFPAKPAAKAEAAAPKINLPADAQVITSKPPIVVRELAEHLKQKP